MERTYTKKNFLLIVQQLSLVTDLIGIFLLCLTNYSFNVIYYFQSCRHPLKKHVHCKTFLIPHRCRECRGAIPAWWGSCHHLPGCVGGAACSEAQWRLSLRFLRGRGSPPPVPHPPALYLLHQAHPLHHLQSVLVSIVIFLSSPSPSSQPSHQLWCFLAS